MIKEIDISELQTLRSKGSVRLVDVRTDAEVARGRIEGAQHIPLHLLPVKAHELEEGQTTVFYCQTGGRSAQACMYLAAKGRGNVYNLRGGIMAWMRAGQGLAR